MNNIKFKMLGMLRQEPTRQATNLKFGAGRDKQQIGDSNIC
jgi:hypothetical protein